MFKGEDSLDKDIGQAIKRIRSEMKLTLKDIAERTELSVSYLSLVERGLSSPTIVNLQKICRILNITMSGLLANTEPDLLLVKYDQRRVIYDDQKGVLMEATTDGSRNMTGVCMTITDMEKHLSSAHVADELGTVISGSMVMTMGGVDYVMREGDSLYIPAFTPHSFAKTSRKECVSLWVYNKPTKEGEQERDYTAALTSEASVTD